MGRLEGGGCLPLPRPLPGLESSLAAMRVSHAKGAGGGRGGGRGLPVNLSDTVMEGQGASTLLWPVFPSSTSSSSPRGIGHRGVGALLTHQNA